MWLRRACASLWEPCGYKEHHTAVSWNITPLSPAGSTQSRNLIDTLLETPIYRSCSRKLIQPGRLVSDTRSLVWREGQSALMASTCGARVSLVTMDLALAVCSRYLRSFAVSWEIPGIMTTPWATQRREVVRQEEDSNAEARETSG